MNMFDDIKEGSKLLLRAIVKGVTGFIIIPMGLLVDQAKPGWETASIPVKIFTGILLIPMVAFLYFAMPWWSDFDIAD